MATRYIDRRPSAADVSRGLAAGLAVDSSDEQLYVNPAGTRRKVESGRARTLAAATVLTAADSGDTLFLSAATEFAVTLPAVAAGLRFTFFVAAAPSGASYTIVSASSANIIVGTIHSSTGGDADSEVSGGDTFSFVDGAATKGDRVDIFCDGTSWYATAFVNADTGATITTAS
jgi:hypothetical protein